MAQAVLMLKFSHPQCKVPLATRTSLGLGGAADYLWQVDDGGALPHVLETISAATQDTFILGGGSNLVVSDDGVEGSVITLSSKKVPSFEKDVVVVDAGFDWDSFVALSVSKGRSGIELMSGIPGRVGGAPIQNIGAYGQEISDVVEWVEIVWLDSGRIERFDNRACKFSYRDSIFKREHANKVLVTQVAFRLPRSTTVGLSYRDLVETLGERSTPEVARSRVLEIRTGKGMTLDHGFGFRSAGSFFMNPIISEKRWLELIARAGENVPSWSQQDGSRKIAGAWLIENAGFAKGTRSGGVGVSPRHALSLVNFGGGTSTELLRLAVSIQDRVFNEFGIWLIMEPVIVGRDIEQFMRLKSERHGGD